MIFDRQDLQLVCLDEGASQELHMLLCTIATRQAQVARMCLSDCVCLTKVPATWSFAMCILHDVGALWTSHA